MKSLLIEKELSFNSQKLIKSFVYIEVGIEDENIITQSNYALSVASERYKDFFIVNNLERERLKYLIKINPEIKFFLDYKRKKDIQIAFNDIMEELNKL